MYVFLSRNVSSPMWSSRLDPSDSDEDKQGAEEQEEPAEKIHRCLGDRPENWADSEQTDNARGHNCRPEENENSRLCYRNLYFHHFFLPREWDWPWGMLRLLTASLV